MTFDRTTAEYKESPPDHYDGTMEEWSELSYDMQYYHWNKEKQDEQRERHRQKRREWYHDLKRERGCKLCDEDEPVCLDFHHTSDDKKASVGTLATGGYAKETVLEEVEKCDLLCANCHRKVTYDVI